MSEESKDKILYCGPADGVRDFFKDPSMPKTIGELITLERYFDDPSGGQSAQDLIDEVKA